MAGAPLPAKREVGQWVVFGDAQTGKLDEANDKKNTALWIVDNCETEKNRAMKEVTSKSLLDRLAFWR